MGDKSVEPVPRLVDHPERPVLGVGHTAGEFDQPGQDRLEIQATTDRYARIEEELEPRSIGDTGVHSAILDRADFGEPAMRFSGDPDSPVTDGS